MKRNKVTHHAETSTIGMDMLLATLERAEAIFRTNPGAWKKSSVAETLIESVKAET